MLFASCGNGDNALEEIINGGGSGGGSSSVTSITLNESTLNMTVGGADVTLTATVDPAGATVSWSSDNEAAATVADGVVHAVAMGTAIITAKAGDKSATCEVTVTPSLSTPLTVEVITKGTITVVNAQAGMQYSTDGGVTKKSISYANPYTLNDGNDFSVGTKVEFYGDGTTITRYAGTQIGGTAQVKVYGNIMSLVDETGFATNNTLPASQTFEALFMGYATLKDASGLLLPATDLAGFYNCYEAMFSGCTSLTAAPALKAETLGKSCYYEMFKGCTSLTTAPALPAETLIDCCYQSMFEGCSSLTTAPELKATTLQKYCYA